MKIGFILPSIKVGGGVRVILELANQLSEENDVEVIYPKQSNTQSFQINKKIKVKEIGLSGGVFSKIINLIFIMLYTRNQDRIYISTGPTLSPFLIIGKKIFNFIQANDYCIFDDRYLIKNNFILRMYKYLTRISYGYKNVRFIFNSRYSYEQFIEVSLKKNTPFLLVHPSINHKVFFPAITPKLKKKLRIGTVARKHPLKGFSTFTEIMKRKDNKNIEVIVISHDDLDEFDVPENWKVYKPLTDIELANIYRSCDIFISTSIWEGFGLPALEAMACGCAIITSQSGGCKEYAKNMYNALIYSPTNHNELEDHIESLIINKSLREQLSQNGITTSGEFTWEISSHQLKNIIKSEQ